MRVAYHIMTRMTGPDCAVMCNLINTHTHTHTVQHSMILASPLCCLWGIKFINNTTNTSVIKQALVPNGWVGGWLGGWVVWWWVVVVVVVVVGGRRQRKVHSTFWVVGGVGVGGGWCVVCGGLGKVGWVGSV